MKESKACTKCGQIKSIDDFHKHKKTYDGLSERCKACRLIDAASYRERNRAKIIQTNREYYDKNRAKKNAERSALYWANVEANREKSRARYLETAEEQKQASRRWRKNNPEKMKSQERTRRARKASVYSEPYTKEEVLNYWGTNCHLCLLPIDLSAPRWNAQPGWELGLHLDHVVPIVLGGADTLANVKPAHGLCNLKKSKR